MKETFQFPSFFGIYLVNNLSYWNNQLKTGRFKVKIPFLLINREYSRINKILIFN